MKKKSLLLLLLLFVPGLLFLNYIGVFTSIKVEVMQMGPYQIVYKKKSGAYKFSGSTILEVKTALTKKGIVTGNAFGIFYDDPKITREAALKYDAGFIVPTPIQDTTGSGLQSNLLKKTTCVMAAYPNQNFLSVYSGMAKVYPKIFKKAKELGYSKRPVMEIYEADKIIYLMPLEK